MILTIAAVIAAGYVAMIFLGIGISFVIGLITGDWETFNEDFVGFVYLNGGLITGLAVGVLVFGNLMNYASDGNFAVEMFDPNLVGITMLVVGIIFWATGKSIMEKKEKKIESQKQEKYVTLKSGKRVKI